MKKADRKALDSEKDLGDPVIAWLEDHGWEVYQEVAGPHGGVADIVATLGSLMCVVELKKSMTFDLLAEAKRWLRYANWTYMAVPMARDSDGRRLAFQIAELLGIGIMTVTPGRYDGNMPNRVDVRLVPKLQRRVPSDLRDMLRPAHKTFSVAGAAHGRHWTAFQDTCEQIANFVRNTPGASLGQVIGGIKHHYRTESTAKACLVQWGKKGVIRGVVLRKQGRRVLFDPDPAWCKCASCGWSVETNVAHDQPEMCEGCRRGILRRLQAEKRHAHR